MAAPKPYIRKHRGPVTHPNAKPYTVAERWDRATLRIDVARVRANKAVRGVHQSYIYAPNAWA